MVALFGFEFVGDVCMGRGMMFALITGFARGSDREMELNKLRGTPSVFDFFREGGFLEQRG